MFGFFRKKKSYHHVDPDEIFLDSKNLPNFNTQQFEGVIERPISKATFVVLGFVLAFVGIFFIVRLGILQIHKGQTYFAQSEENRLHQITIFSKRGVIYDRNGVELAWNIVGEDDEPFSYRKYIEKNGFAHVLGFVRYPKKDSSGFFWRLDLEGADGVEALFDDSLQGENGLKLLETDALLDIKSESLVQPSEDGENLSLTLDAGVQSALHDAIARMVQDFDYLGGAAVIMDVTNGDLISLTSYPEFDSEIISLGKDSEAIDEFFNGETKPSLNRAISGLYTPGSTVKPFAALGMLEEGIITTNSRIYSSGTLEIPNRWDPDNPSIFRDWRPEGHGNTDVYHAIADSVNKFFYVFGGGYQDIEGLGIKRLQNYFKKFKLGEPTGFSLGAGPRGIIPNPEWKEKVFEDGTWRVGDTYNTVIGQFGFQVTPMQMVRAIAAIANNGELFVPRISVDEPIKSNFVTGIDDVHFQTIRDAMRQTVTDGTAKIFNVSYGTIAAKTGTAQTRGKTRVNAWSTGFFPYENPKYAFTIVMEEGPNKDNVGASWAIRQMFDWMSENAPEYFVDQEIEN